MTFNTNKSEDYSDMHFSKEDTEQLIANRDKICEWIMQNIVPELDEDDHIMIDYGGEYLGVRSYTKTTNYHIAVYGKEREFTSGGGTRTQGHIGIGERYGYISHALKGKTNPYDIYPIVVNWRNLKDEMTSQLHRKKSNRRKIYTFEV